MATEQLQISGWDSGWEDGLATNIDEPIASADGQYIRTRFHNNSVILDLDNVTNIADIDTVNSITVTVRTRGSITGTTVTSLRLYVQLLVGSVGQGTEEIADINTVGWTNTPLTNAGWDADWSVSQLNGMQVQLTSFKVPFSTDTCRFYVDTIDVVIDYTPLAALTEDPGAGSLTLTGKVPTAVEAGGEQSVRPAAAIVTLAGQAQVLDKAIPVGATSLSIIRQKSYLNPLTAQFQVNGWDAGWPIGNASNVDDRTDNPDGQVVSSSIASDEAIFDFDDVSGTILPTDDILRIEFVVRVRSTGAPTAGIPVQLLVNDIQKGTVVFGSGSLSSSLQNYNVTSSFFWQNSIGNGTTPVLWTVSELDTMQLKVFTPASISGGELIAIDAIDAIITYSSQSPLLEKPGVTDLDFTTYAPTIAAVSIRNPAAASVALAGYAPTIVRADASQVSEEILTLQGKVPTILGDHISLPATGTLTIVEGTPVIEGKNLPLPAAETLVLAGQAPTATAVDNHVRLPARRKLTLFKEAPLISSTTNTVLGPVKGTAAFVGKAPTAARTTSVFKTIAKVSRSLSGKAPTLVRGQVRGISGKALTLTEYAPVRVPGALRPVSEVALTFNGLVPLPATEFTVLSIGTYAPVALVNFLRTPATTTLVLTGRVPVSKLTNLEVVAEGALSLDTYAPTLEFSTFIGTGPSRLISLSIDYDIEHIATPLGV